MDLKLVLIILTIPVALHNLGTVKKIICKTLFFDQSLVKVIANNVLVKRVADSNK